MIRIYGTRLPANPTSIRVGGTCPHCKQGGHFTPLTTPIPGALQRDGVEELIMCYACDTCLKAIPVSWRVAKYAGTEVLVDTPKAVLPVREAFEFHSVPDEVRKEIEEALDCLSVGAYNGF